MNYTSISMSDGRLRFPDKLKTAQAYMGLLRGDITISVLIPVYVTEGKFKIWTEFTYIF